MPDLTRVLDQHLAAGFPTDLALDLVLNELVVRAADATGASAAALALFRGDEMVCRAAAGLHAPDLGIPLSTRDGLSGACVLSGTAQLCDDAESDPRVDALSSRRLGIRSMLIVPVFDGYQEEDPGIETQPVVTGILEVLSPVPNAFSRASQSLLEEFARECAHISRAAEHLRILVPAEVSFPPDPEVLKSFESLPEEDAVPAATARQPYQAWTLVLSALVFLAAIGVSFMVGSRFGWLRSEHRFAATPPSAEITALLAETEKPAAVPQPESPRVESPRKESPRPKMSTRAPSDSANSPPAAGELVVYEKGKVIFRMKQPQNRSEGAALAANASVQGAANNHAPAPIASSVVPASSGAHLTSSNTVWLAPDAAEGRLVRRVEPQYPPDALAAGRSGSVVLEINVAEDGTVSSVRPLIGDPALAAAAADAVRTWRYQPYRSREHLVPFQTDVTLNFSLPN